MILSDYKRRSPEQQLADLNAAWDRIKKQTATIDRQDAKILRQDKKIQSLEREKILANLKLWIMGGVMMALWEVLKFLILHH